MIWSAILRGVRELMLAHTLNRDAHRHVIKGAKGTSHLQAAARAIRRVYAASGFR